MKNYMLLPNREVKLGSFSKFFLSFISPTVTLSTDIVVAAVYEDGEQLFFSAETAFIPSSKLLPASYVAHSRPAVEPSLEADASLCAVVVNPTTCDGHTITKLRVFLMKTVSDMSIPFTGSLVLATDRGEQLKMELGVQHPSACALEVFQVEFGFIATGVRRIDLPIDPTDFFQSMLGMAVPEKIVTSTLVLDELPAVEAISIPAGHEVPLAETSTPSAVQPVVQLAPVATKPQAAPVTTNMQPSTAVTPTSPMSVSQPAPTPRPVPQPVPSTTPVANPTPAASIPAPQVAPNPQPAPVVPPAVMPQPVAQPVAESAGKPTTPAAPAATTESTVAVSPYRMSSRSAFLREKLFNFEPNATATAAMVEMICPAHLNCELGIYIRRTDGESEVYFATIDHLGSFDAAPHVLLVPDEETDLTRHILVNVASLQPFQKLVFFARAIEATQRWDMDGLSFRFVIDNANEPYVYTPEEGLESAILRLSQLVADPATGYRFAPAALTCEKFVELDTGI